MAHLVRGGALALILAAAGCGSSGGGSASNDCAKVVLTDHTTGGCNIRLAQPIGCQTIDLSGGKTATLEWVTDNTICTTPWFLCVGGSPADFVTPTNAGCVQINQDGVSVFAKTAIVTVRATDFATLTSPSGVYYWTVTNFSRTSYPATQPFKILK